MEENGVKVVSICFFNCDIVCSRHLSDPFRWVLIFDQADSNDTVVMNAWWKFFHVAAGAPCTFVTQCLYCPYTVKQIAARLLFCLLSITYKQAFRSKQPVAIWSLCTSLCTLRPTTLCSLHSLATFSSFLPLLFFFFFLLSAASPLSFSLRHYWQYSVSVRCAW